MPWTVKDVDGKKKGLNASQKKKWVRIANGALKKCQSEGGSDCDGRAIRIANAAFSMEVETMNEKMKIPEAALHFMDHQCLAKAEVGKEEGAKAKLNMLAYSGKPIKNHWYWGDLVIDLDGMKFEKKAFPILENHRTDRKIAFSNGKPVIENYQLKANPDSVEFVDTEYANEFIKLSKQGFPYESSIYAVPSTIERLEEGASAEVNGFTLKGPAAIWRQSTFKEMSVCVFGHDSNARSEAFSKDEIELDMEVQTSKVIDTEVDQESTGKEVVSSMTLEELKTQNPEAYNALKEEVKAEVTEAVTSEVEQKFAKEKEDLENKHTEEKSGLTDRILELEKRDAIRSEAELKHRADGIWAHKLSESDIPEHLYGKVSAHVSHSKFVKEGILDEKSFSEAIEAEIKDWQEKGVTSSVLGMSFTQKKESGDDDTDATKFAKENDAAVETLSQFVSFGKQTN
jgi:hypothetical protein